MRFLIRNGTWTPLLAGRCYTFHMDEDILRKARDGYRKAKAKRMQNGQPKQALPGLTIVANPDMRTNDNPNGIGIASNMPPWATAMMLSEAIRVLAQSQVVQEAARIKVSKAGLVLPNGQPAPIDEPETLPSHAQPPFEVKPPPEQ